MAKSALPASIYQTETKTGRIRNFEKAGRSQGEVHEGIYYDDSDVYKAIEAIAYSLQNIPDAALEQKADEWIDKIALAQEQDGYINTYYSLTGLENRWPRWAAFVRCGTARLKGAARRHRCVHRRILAACAGRAAPARP